ncbi:MAG: GGDEF domain-containing protein [Gammaproteobacteria bacterium]|nr:MAG: GGDEF domain-containing protein [Gammaproteobacteria bacterium]
MIVQQPAAKNELQNVIPYVGKDLLINEPEFNNDSANRKFSLMNRLQTTLEVQEIFDIFSKALAEMVNQDGITYTGNEYTGIISLGSARRAKLTYNLKADGLSLGEIKVFRTKKFTDKEVVMVEDYISLLYYPLRNAIMYNQALQSALRDPLTKLHNRAMLEQHLARESQLAQRHEEEFSMIMIDVDKFKEVNDEYGHQAGDAILCKLADIMREYGRASDMLFRFAGDEFVITLRKTSIAGAQMLANRIRQAVENARVEYKGNILSLSISMGVAALKCGETTEELFARADQALYQAKEGGRNQVCA